MLEIRVFTNTKWMIHFSSFHMIGEQLADGTLVNLIIYENCIGVISLAFMTYTTTYQYIVL